MNELIRYFIKQPMLVNIITLIVLGFGIYSLFFVKREAFPSIDFDTISVFTVYPGASPETVEKLITTPLEDNLQDVDGIKRMQSVSTQSTSIISIELDADVTNSRLAQSDIQDVVDSWRELPQTAEDPVVTAINTKLFPVITVAIKGEVEEEILKAVAKSLEAPIEAIADVAKVRFEGIRADEWQVNADPAQLRRWDVTLGELSAALRRNNLNIPGGSLWITDQQSSPAKEVIIRTVGELTTQADIENTVVRANLLGEPIYVKDVAQVNHGFEERKIYLRTGGMPSHNIVVLKKEQGDIIHLVEELKRLMVEEQKMFPEGVTYELIDDSSYIVKRRLNVLSNNLIIGLVLVLIILSLALPSKIALISAFGIPFAFLTAIALMYLLGISVNIISMLGLILVVGMLVDDAVVVTENAQRTMEAGLPPEEAALKSTQEIWPPLLTSVTTTMMAFAPLLFMGGTLGKFIQYVPYGVLLGLTASLFECFFILPNHIAHWVKQSPKHRQPRQTFWQTQIIPRYGAVLHWIIKLRYLGIVLVVILLGATAWLFKTQMGFMMFPRGGIAEFTIRIEGEVGIPLSDTLAVIKQIETAVATLPLEELQEFESVVGRYSMGNQRGTSGSQYGQVTVRLTDANDRTRSVTLIIDELKAKIGSVPQTKIRFAKRRAGPPVGRPVAIGVRGEDYAEIQTVVAEVKSLLETEPGVTDISDTFTPGKEEVHLMINPQQAAAAGLTLNTIGQTVRTAFEGTIPTTIRQASEEVDIRVKLDNSHHNNLATLKELTITNARGQRIPLDQVAAFERRASIASYEREDNQRQIVVQADINYRQTTPLAVNAAMAAKLLPLEEQYPNISFHFGGEQQDTEENSKELLRIVIITFCGIFLLLTLLFNNIFQPFLISLTIPLAIIPVVWAFYLHNMTLTFFALIGMVALAGVIVNNAIVLTSFINTHRRQGMAATASIIAACQTRLRPILLTTVTTVSGILPTAYGIGGLDPFVVPLAMALGWGLALGSILVCLVYPIFLAIFDDLGRIAITLKHAVAGPSRV